MNAQIDSGEPNEKDQYTKKEGEPFLCILYHKGSACSSAILTVTAGKGLSRGGFRPKGSDAFFTDGPLKGEHLF